MIKTNDLFQSFKSVLCCRNTTKDVFGVNYGVISTLNIPPKNDFIRTVKQAASQYGDYIKNVFILLPSKGFLMIKACFNQLMIFY
jgi:hypothetical protein